MLFEMPLIHGLIKFRRNYRHFREFGFFNVEQALE